MFPFWCKKIYPLKISTINKISQKLTVASEHSDNLQIEMWLLLLLLAAKKLLDSLMGRHFL